ncbi:hypothetical protein EHQ52_03170 [Leptospira koniambonensis]|uniref:YokE-like PH domain-containing protein n=1 Tax=Leptospira koniambonensis TaxID=2484950 RepID=A0A4R9JBP8_9LEPT|nr:hypothetical protein [Leptospira koniambonensis]TGL36887.1 hypothetical protein EHQ52_03170 [Leptospira koniambonensis]
MKNKIQQLSYRILEKLNDFHSEVPSSLHKIAQNEILGIYLNSSSYFEDSILFTDLGMYIIQSEEKSEYIEYNEILNLKVIEQKEVAESISIERKDGSRIEVKVLGGKERLRDVWEVYRFLLRATGEVRKYT